MTDILKGLNEIQKEAVQATDGPVLILAGAGSGKTKALTHRIAYLIREKAVKPENILAVTFTNKAAKEMTSRVHLLTQNTKDKIQKFPESVGRKLEAGMPAMGTFHSICAKILREDIYRLGYKKNFIIYDESDSQTAIRQAIRKLSLDDRKISINTIKNYISSAKNELVEPEEYLAMSHGYVQEYAAKIYPEYKKILAKNNALDFDDLLFLTVKLFTKEKEVLSYYQDLWKYIHVDEYQDTNHAQYTFVKLLAKKHGNLCVVGDDWQSIYSWRGANFKNILEFERDWPKAKIIKLEQNYRSTKAILDTAHHVITKNVNRSEKKLWTKGDSGLPSVVFEAENEQDEARFVIKEAERLILEEKYKLGDMVVLYRTNAQSRAMEAELVKFGLPYRIVGGVRFYERKEIKDILAYLRIVSSDDDWVAFERAINIPPRGIGVTSVHKLVEYSTANNLGILDTLKSAKIHLTPKIQEGVSDFYRTIFDLREKMVTLKLSDFIERAIKKSGYEAHLDDGTGVNEDRLQNLRELISVGKEYELANGAETNLEGFLEEIALVSDVDNWKQSEESLTLMTLHAAKGLEFKAVFMIGVEENLFPHANTVYDSDQLEEERRLCYVGVTRAKERLYFVYARRRLLYGNTRNNAPSRFLSEIPEHLLIGYEVVLSGEVEEVSPDQTIGFFNAGDVVLHEEFGEGVVLESDDDEILVDFEGLGEKWLSLSYANLKRK